MRLSIDRVELDSFSSGQALDINVRDIEQPRAQGQIDPAMTTARFVVASAKASGAEVGDLIVVVWAGNRTSPVGRINVTQCKVAAGWEPFV